MFVCLFVCLFVCFWGGGRGRGIVAVITTGTCLSLRFINCLCYYVLAMNAGSLGGNRYVSFTLSGLVDIPSLIICYFLIKRYAVCKCSSFISRPQMRKQGADKEYCACPCEFFKLVHACARFNTSTIDGGATTKLMSHLVHQVLWNM